MAVITLADAPVLVKVRCPICRSTLPVSVPSGTPVGGYCRKCGREFVLTVAAMC